MKKQNEMKMKKVNYNDLKKEEFFKFYKFLFDEQFSKLSDSAKILYTVLRDRLNMTLNNIDKGDTYWLDDNGNVFIKASIENIMQFMNCASQKAVKLKKELVKYNLIQDVYVGTNKSNKIYIMEVDYLKSIDITLDSENQNPGILKITIPGFRKSLSNKNNLKKNNFNKNNKQYTQEKSNINTNSEKNKKNIVVVKNKTSSTNNNLNLEENKDNTNNTNITKELIQKVKNRYEEVTKEKTTTVNIKELLQKKGEDIINTYLDNIDNFTINISRAGFMRDAILENWNWTEKKNNGTYQRKKYEADKYYDDIDVEALETNPKEIKL